MKPISGKRGRFPVVWRAPAWMASVLLLLSACGEGPNDPRPPYSPPRPVTSSLGYAITAQLELPARPVLPPPGQM